MDIAGKDRSLNNGAWARIAASPVGTGMTCPTATGTTVQRDLREWCQGLQGAAEVSDGSRVGAMIGGRGCCFGCFRTSRRSWG